MKTNEFGEMSWSRTYGESMGDATEEVIELENGGLAIFGSTSSFGAGSNDFYFLKTNPNGIVY